MCSRVHRSTSSSTASTRTSARRLPRSRRVATAEELLAEQEANADHHIHMPSPSYWPMVLAAALPIIALGLIYAPLVAMVGGVIALLAMFGWALEPSVADESDFEPRPDDTPGAELATVGGDS